MKIRQQKDNAVSPPYEVSYSKPFLKDWEKLARSGRYDMRQLKNVMMQLIAGDVMLDPEFRDHQLRGTWLGYRECHIGGDFLLIYQFYENKMIYFSRAGTHSELFRN